jgi:Methylase involved in ubiquinone/menaquinone biosynthesis
LKEVICYIISINTNRGDMNRKPEPDWAFKMMSLIHDNPLRQILTDPYKILKTAGLCSGQRAVEIGPGPGFFTIPAAKIVGEKGIVYAIDIHPLAIKRIQEKIRKEGITNVKAILADASQTGLPDQSVDLAFLFGIVHHIDKDLEAVLNELCRILRIGGVLSIQSSSSKRLVELVERNGFVYSRDKDRIFSSQKNRERKNSQSIEVEG